MIKSTSEFHSTLLKSFPHKATPAQKTLLQLFSDFVFDADQNALFLLKGYAGTGKTTSISTLVDNLWKVGKKCVLLAPTGRAAKVISQYTRKKSLTIHKKIYHSKKTSSGGVEFVRKVNKHTHTYFFVDEASMISDSVSNSKLFDNGSLLNDLISYVYAGKECKLILIGDTAQLPPVKLLLSPALDPDTLARAYRKNITSIELDEVVRQQRASGILANATQLRNCIHGDRFSDFKFNLKFPDIVRLEDGYDIQDMIASAYDRGGVEDTAIIVRSNKRANQYNQQIRTKIRDLESEISVGDYLMAVKNNYFWVKDTSEVSFLANGDTFEVLALYGIKELYGFRFAEVKIRMVDYPNQPPLETVLLLDTLSAESASLSYEQSNKLYQAVSEDYPHIRSKYKKLLEIKNNKYFNALQVKFSYAMTCHKSQGGQWDTVFVEQPYLPEGPDQAYFRWLYTAVTRAKKKLYLLGFRDDAFGSD